MDDMSGTNTNELKADAARHLASNNLPAAIELYARACQENPADAETRLILANLRLQSGDIVNAIVDLRQASHLQPANTTILKFLAELELNTGQWQPCIITCQKLLKLSTNDAAVYSLLGTALQSQGNLIEARQSLERCVMLQPDNAASCYKLACVLQTLGEPDTALHYFTQARRLAPGMSVVVGGLARVYMQKNDDVALRKLLDPLVEAAGRDPLVLPTLASIAPRFGLTVKAKEMLQHAIDTRRLPDKVLARLQWALGTLHESMKDYDNAFRSHAKSKSLAATSYNAIANTDFTNRIISVFSREFLATAPRASDTSQVPLFIVGMPRSGTSLVEQILSSHPEVHGAGELPHITWIARGLSKMVSTGKPYPECSHDLTQNQINECSLQYLHILKQLAPNALRVTDKMPHNFRHLGLIELLFPDARIIHVSRDPLDTCLSCYFQEFSDAHAYTRSLRDLGSHYRDYERLMQHWLSTLNMQLLTLHYEDIVSNLEITARELIEFCGLEWDDTCLDFHRHERVVQTLSSEQVRKPIYSSSVGRWKYYRSHLGELLDILGVTVN